MLLEGIILMSMAQIKNNRTVTAVYYLLAGKRSIQTVQDAHLYQIDQFYGVIPSLKKDEFDHVIKQLTEREMIKEEEENIFILTSLGNAWLEEHLAQLSVHYFNGKKYNENDRIFYERLILMIQVLTNSKMKHSTYIPVIDQSSIKNWVIKAYQKFKFNVDDSLRHIYEEIKRLLAVFSNDEANLFVNRLTGYKAYGMSLNQLADQFNMNPKDVQLRLTGMIHHMLELIINHKQDYKTLFLFIKDLSMTGFISQSASKTKDVLNKGYDLKTISRLRKLKMNTIYDHIVEIALADSSLSIDSYVTQAEQNEILKAYKQTNSTKLKIIKNNINENISYFQIRLVLATSKYK